jgi:glycosyltransferase involved in cell wall biosynthesis
MSDYASCCVLSYERPAFLQTAISTLVSNAGAPLELIVHDDGSANPEVWCLLNDLLSTGLVSTVILNPPGWNQGVGEAIRRCFDLAQGDVLVKVDQDLIFHEGWLARVMGLLTPIEGRVVPLTDATGRATGCTVVDAGDYEAVSQYSWRLHPRGYAATYAEGRTVLLHRLLMEPGDGMQVDHRNRRRLDNRRGNLRVATPGQNQENRTPNRVGTSRHRGVSWNAKERKWYAFAKKDRRNHYLGSFDDEDEAAAVARFWRAENMPSNVEQIEPPEIGLLGLFHYHHDPVDTAKTLIARHDGWQEHSHICGSAFAARREIYEALGIGTHSAAFAEDWELMKLITDATPFVCALPDEDLVENQGFGIGPSTVVRDRNTVQPIHYEPVIFGR